MSLVEKSQELVDLFLRRVLLQATMNHQSTYFIITHPHAHAGGANISRPTTTIATGAVHHHRHDLVVYTHQKSMLRNPCCVNMYGRIKTTRRVRRTGEVMMVHTVEVNQRHGMFTFRGSLLVYYCINTWSFLLTFLFNHFHSIRVDKRRWDKAAITDRAVLAFRPMMANVNIVRKCWHWLPMCNLFNKS
jgi:hypothetical protein